MSTLGKPCLRKCCLDDDDICLGCYRNLNDILKWDTYTGKEKISILEDAKNLRNQNHTKNNWYAFGTVQ